MDIRDTEEPEIENEIRKSNHEELLKIYSLAFFEKDLKRMELIFKEFQNRGKDFWEEYKKINFNLLIR